MEGIYIIILGYAYTIIKLKGVLMFLRGINKNYLVSIYI